MEDLLNLHFWHSPVSRTSPNPGSVHLEQNLEEFDDGVWWAMRVTLKLAVGLLTQILITFWIQIKIQMKEISYFIELESANTAGTD